MTQPSNSTLEVSPQHHPLIATPSVSPLERPAGFSMGFLGIRTRVSFEQHMPGNSPLSEPAIVTPARPAFDEEYFEWVDLMEAVAQGAGDFVMAELGAGFGRWLVRGAVAARLRHMARSTSRTVCRRG